MIGDSLTILSIDHVQQAASGREQEVLWPLKAAQVQNVFTKDALASKCARCGVKQVECARSVYL